MESPTILIVDDNPLNMKLIRVLLTAEGYQVSTAVDAKEALDTLHDCHPRLIVMDIQLPGIDGLELTRQLKADPSSADITILGLNVQIVKAGQPREGHGIRLGNLQDDYRSARRKNLSGERRGERNHV